MREEYLLCMSACFEVLVTYQLFNHFCERKSCSGKRIGLISAITVMIITAVSLLGNFYLNTVMMVVIKLCYAKRLFRCKTAYALFGAAVFVMIGMVAEIAASFGVSFAFGVDISNTMDLFDYKVIVYFISKALLLILTRIIIAAIPSIKQKEINKFQLYLVIFPAFAILNEFLLFYLTMRFQVERKVFLFCMLVGIGLIYSGLLLIMIYEQGIQKCVLENDLQLARQKEEVNDQFYRMQEKNLEEVRAVIHDFKKQLIHLQEMYQNVDPDAAQYHELLTQTLERQMDRQALDINNKVLSSILQRTRISCEQRQIEFEFRTDIYDLGFLSPLDTSTIFDNAIDNAVEACSKVREKSRRSLQLTIHNAGYFILLEFRNSYEAEPLEQNGCLLSTKPEGGIHGYGISNICSTAQKYGGDGAYHYQDGEFILSVRIQNTEE